MSLQYYRFELQQMFLPYGPWKDYKISISFQKVIVYLAKTQTHS